MAKTAAKGTIDNPYSLSECDSMLDAGTWPGGYVRCDDGSVIYTPKGQAVVYGYSGSGSGSGWHGSDYEFCTGSYEWHEPDTDTKGCDEDGKDTPSGSGTGGNAGGGTGGGYHPATPMPMMGKMAHFCTMQLTIQRSSITRCAGVGFGRAEMSIRSAMWGGIV